MLHSCGQHINISAYHKHTWYLIRHGELLGYSEVEHLMVAAIARYHRRSLPRSAMSPGRFWRPVSIVAAFIRWPFYCAWPLRLIAGLNR